MKLSFRFVLFVISIVLPLRAETLTYSDLVDRLYDLQHLATPPAPGEKGEMASSYDRHRKYDAATDKYIDWGANGDANFGGAELRPMEGDKVVLADIQGPGCIWRIWSAQADVGHVRIYLDGATTPVIDLPFRGFFEGQNQPFTRPQLVYENQGRGFNNYTPISFQKSCKILADQNWGIYYHINYTKFPPGTIVPTLTLPLPAADAAALDKANAIFAKCGDDPAGPRQGEKTETIPVTAAPRAQTTVAELNGAQAITAIRIKFTDGQLPADAEAQRTFLRKLALRINFDGESKSAVWVPLGDFFGNGSGVATHLELPSGTKDDGTWYSYWYMPFGNGAKVVLDNDSDKNVSLNWEIVHAPLQQPAVSLLRFHAKWHRDAFLPTRPDRAPDWTLLIAQGAGRYVGTQLNVWNPLSGWWGEGDEKWFIDGEKMPSTIGTGTEDYFGYAWSSLNRFSQALHAQIYNDNIPDYTGHISVNRWHIADNLPFHTQFEGIIEKYKGNDMVAPNDGRGTQYAATAFFYLSADGKDPYEPVPVAQRIGYWFVFKVPGVIEGEDMTLASPSDDGAGRWDMWGVGPSKWSNNQVMFWKAKIVGQKLDLGFINPGKAGKYQVLIRLTKCEGYGIHQFSIDGQKAGDPIDDYAKGIDIGDPVSLGTFDVTAGQNVISAVVTGKNPASSGYQMGIDYIKLVPVP